MIRPANLLQVLTQKKQKYMSIKRKDKNIDIHRAFWEETKTRNNPNPSVGEQFNKLLGNSAMLGHKGNEWIHLPVRRTLGIMAQSLTGQAKKNNVR